MSQVGEWKVGQCHPPGRSCEILGSILHRVRTAAGDLDRLVARMVCFPLIFQQSTVIPAISGADSLYKTMGKSLHSGAQIPVFQRFTR